MTIVHCLSLAMEISLLVTFFLKAAICQGFNRGKTIWTDYGLSFYEAFPLERDRELFKSRSAPYSYNFFKSLDVPNSQIGVADSCKELKLSCDQKCVFDSETEDWTCQCYDGFYQADNGLKLYYLLLMYFPRNNQCCHV